MRWLALVLGLAACAKGGVPAVDGGPGAADGRYDGSPCTGEDYPCDGIYVRADTGNDSNPGTRELPLKTISAGIASAQLGTPRPVLVGSGTYSESVTMHDGVAVYGGVDSGWTRNGETTTIVGGLIAVQVFSTTMEARLDGVIVKSADADAAGTTIGIVITGSQNVELIGVTVEPGAGGRGVDGVDGSIGTTGSMGTTGGPGVEHSSALFCDENTVPAGGPG